MSHYPRRATILVLAIALIAVGAWSPRVVAGIQDSSSGVSSELDRLELDVQRATALRDAKRLQYLYSQFGEYGLWDEMAALFATNAQAIFGDTVVSGREAIRRYLVTTLGAGKDGMAVGSLYTQILQAPVVTLAPD